MKNYGSYFDYEFDLGRDVVSSSLGEFGVSVEGRSILDVGCGEGGVLAGLAENHSFTALGLDYDDAMISRSRAVEGVIFRHADFLEYNFDDKYDIVLLRDVLEHCGDPESFLKKIATVLKSDSQVYITYTPYLSPFGGHQHNGDGFFSNVPYVHLLPDKLFMKLVTPQGNVYKNKDHLIKDFQEIRTTWITTGKVKQICRQAKLSVSTARAFIVRPDYKYKFNLKPVPFPTFMPLGTVTDALCTSVEMILKLK